MTDSLVGTTHKDHMMKMMNRINSATKLFLLILSALFLVTQAHAAQPSAKSSVDKMVAAIRKHPSLDIIFTVWDNGNSTTGSMSVAGRNFHLSTPQMKVWYDGKTQWSYLHSAGEVNVTQPTEAELAQTNPLSILSSLGKNFTFRRLKASGGVERIELIPARKSSDFASAIVTITSATSLPKEIVVKDAKGHLTTIRISSIKGGKTKPAAAFRFPAASYPGVEVVDLR